jgi:hypothetical protein
LLVYIVTANGFFSRGHFGELLETENITKDIGYNNHWIGFVDISGCSCGENSAKLSDAQSQLVFCFVWHYSNHCLLTL